MTDAAAAMELLARIAGSCREILGEKLVGVYAHGSIAFGCFNWDKSDIDFLVVTARPPSLAEKEALLSVLLELDGEAPPKGLEMSVVLESVCRNFVYPTPFELHLSNAHRERCRTDLQRYALTMNGTDPDLAAHFTVTRETGITLCGRELSEVFGEVPREAYLNSIRADIADAACAIAESPVSVVLNLCRVLACRREGLVLSKERGGSWGLARLPEPHRPLVAHALACYRGDGSYEPDPDAEGRFVRYLLSEIFR